MAGKIHLEVTRAPREPRTEIHASGARIPSTSRLMIKALRDLTRYWQLPHRPFSKTSRISPGAVASLVFALIRNE